MTLNEFDLDTDCVAVRFETGNLMFACQGSAPDAPMALVIVNPQDDRYLSLMTWAISNQKITP